MFCEDSAWNEIYFAQCNVNDFISIRLNPDII